MHPLKQLLRSSIGKKYVMALSGLVLVLFVLGHMLGNLQMFMGPESINTYAHNLQTLPFGLLWVFRLFLLACVALHVWMAVVLTIENRKARPEKYACEASVQASYASRTMPWSGVILLAFIIFHLLHYTVRVIYDYSDLPYMLGDTSVHNVYAMMILGFSHWYVSLFYVGAMALLCLHLSHGFSSMFQSLGIRNHFWRRVLANVAMVYGGFIFLGFVSVPVMVLLSKFAGVDVFPVEEILLQYGLTQEAAAVK